MLYTIIARIDKSIDERFMKAYSCMLFIAIRHSLRFAAA